MRSLLTAAFAVMLAVCTVSVPAHACTSFCMDTPDGTVFGANLDLFIRADGFVFVNRRGVEKATYVPSASGERASWTSRYGSVTFSIAGKEHAWSGMNEAGLVLSSMELRAGKYPEPDHRPRLLDHNWGQYVLDNCATVAEVTGMDTVVTIGDYGYTSHYLVVDAEGNCLAVEYIDGRFTYYTGDDIPVKAMSNMRYDQALAAYERGGPRWWWSNPGQSAERFAACKARSDAFDPACGTSAVDYAFETLLRYVAAPHTRWSVVYDIKAREIWFRSVQSPAIKHISMSSFEYSCDRPQLMLDMNSQLEGDVEGHFVPYDSELNHNLFRTFCGRWGIELSEQDARNATGFFDSFECAD